MTGVSGINALDRFMDKVDVTTQNDCLLWTGKNVRGHGQFSFNGKYVYAHRFIWEWCEGKIPDGLVIDHTCRNPSCVNTSHLRVVSIKQNALENSVSPPALNNAKTHCLNGHLLDDSNTYTTRLGARGCRECRRRRSREWRALHPGYADKYWDKYHAKLRRET